MLVFTSMTVKILIQSFTKQLERISRLGESNLIFHHCGGMRRRVLVFHPERPD